VTKDTSCHYILKTLWSSSAGNWRIDHNFILSCFFYVWHE